MTHSDTHDGDLRQYFVMVESGHQEATAHIEIARRTALQDVARRYTVLIDDQPVGTISLWGTRSFEVIPGHHVVRLRAGTGQSSSGDVPVEVQARQVARLRTWSRLRRLPFSIKGIVTFFINPSGYGLGTWEWDPFGLWGNPRPWIILSREKPHPGPRRFDADETAPTSDRHPSVQSPLLRLLEDAEFDLDRHGYRADDVDRFIAKLRLCVESGVAIGASDLDVTFDTGHRGYSQAQVDVFIEAVKDNLGT